VPDPASDADPAPTAGVVGSSATTGDVRLHLVDGTYELFRAHFSKRPARTDAAGRDVKATVGMVSSLLGLLADAEERPTHIAVAFDNPIESWRNRRFPPYKSSEGVDPDLLAQFDRAEAAVRAVGVTVWSMDEHEADDALATAAVRFAPEVGQVRILTPDKDLAQVVTGRRIVQVDRRRETVRDEAGVREKFGVGPRSIPDLLALVGDTADGIPGLSGFGAKSAASVLARYEHLDAIPDDGDDWDVTVRGAAKLAATLREHRADAELYRELTLLALDVGLGGDLEDLAWHGVPRAAYLAWCDELGLGNVRDRPHRWA
jgi:5'-3' exonuclease